MAANRKSYRYSIGLSGLRCYLVALVRAASTDYLNSYPESSIFKWHGSQPQANALMQEINRIYNYYNTFDEKEMKQLEREYTRQLAIWVCEEIMALQASKKHTLSSILQNKTYDAIVNIAQILYPDDGIAGELAIDQLLTCLQRSMFAQTSELRAHAWLENGFRGADGSEIKGRYTI